MKEGRCKKALIMAAGYGTRMEPLTLAVPKPMVPIVNKPTMQHNIELLRRNGIRDIVANIHYHPEQIENFFEDGDAFGVNLAYSYEEKLLGTAGGVRRMGRRVSRIDETFMVLSSDALTDINIRKLVSFHKKKKALATIALMPVEDTTQFGVVILDKDQKVTSFQEKPKKENALSNLANTGIYVFEPEILDMIPEDQFYDFGHELFPMLAKKKAPVYGYKMVEFWSDVGGIGPYIAANQDAIQGNVRIVIPGRKISSKVWVGKGARISKSAQFEGYVIVGDKCEIRDGAYLKNVVLGDMCVVGNDARISHCVIWSDTFVSHGADIDKSIIGNWCQIGENARIEQNSVIPNRCVIRKGSHLPEGTKLKPSKTL